MFDYTIFRRRDSNQKPPKNQKYYPIAWRRAGSKQISHSMLKDGTLILASWHKRVSQIMGFYTPWYDSYHRTQRAPLPLNVPQLH